MNTNAEVLAAEEALERAKAVRDGANATLKAAMQAVFDADRALQKAKVRADDHLPRADSCAAGWAWAAGKVIRRAVVIVRRTAETITTRTPGHPEEQQWRKDAQGKWRQWPDRGSTRWLEVAE